MYLAQINLDPLPNVEATQNTALIITQTIFGIIGSICMIVILLLAFKFITSRGNPEATGKLRDGIVFAGIGLAVCVAAASIVSLVVGRVR
jgi:sterol desaturase/sphingolipid hydroxylase (fatty acid hydroxylase superfamily)